MYSNKTEQDMTNALEILAVCGRKKSSKNILCNNAL